MPTRRSGAPLDIAAHYDIDSRGSDSLENWYKAKPYCFRIRDKDNIVNDFYLPISPSNLDITTHFATNVIPTMYGTVEEHSEQRYFDIIIKGTTGFAPKFLKADPAKPSNLSSNASTFFDKFVNVNGSNSPKTGRASFTPGVSTEGLFKRTAGLARLIAEQASRIFADRFEDKTSAIPLESSGYYAFHNFYRSLLEYKNQTVRKDNDRRKDGTSSFGKRIYNHPLTFVNYKDNNQYNVAIQNFQLSRSADDPFLYNYNIIMRGYKLETADDFNKGFVDADRLASLGLDGVESSSVFAFMANKSRLVKNTAYAAIALVKGAGS